MAISGDDEGYGNPPGDGGPVGAHCYGIPHHWQLVGGLQGEGYWKVGPRTWGAAVGCPLCSRVVLERLADSGRRSRVSEP